MKRITFLGFVLILLASILFGRVNWGVSDSLNNIVIRPGTSIPINAVEIHPAPFPFPWASSVTPPHYRQNSEYGAEFIGVDYRGWCGRIGGTYTFKRQLGSFIDSISQAIIWFCADDTVDQIGVKWDGTTRWETNIPANHYAGNNQMYEIHRVDLTDLFLGYDYTSVCSLIIPVRNTTISYIGLNYFYTIEDSIELTAYDSYSITKGWNYISMPFRVADTSYSLSSLFPGVTEAWYGNEYLCDWDSLDVSAHLTGELGDICRSRSLLLWSDSTDQILVYGYPIYEQHYMDKRPQTTNFQFLFHGTVNCIVPYNCSLKQPDDIGDSCVVLAAHEKSYGELLIYSFVDSINIFSSPCFEGYYSVFDFDSCCHLALWCGGAPDTFGGEIMFGEGFGLYDEYYEIDTNLALFEPVIFDSTAFPSSPPPPPTHRSEFHKSASSRPASTSIEVSASPNPFNSTVEIRVNNIDTEKLTVAILDIYGKCIRNKFNINMDDKNTSVIWNGTDNNGEFVPSGVYFYIISTARENVPVDCCWLNKSQYKYSYFSPSKFPLI